MDYLLILQLHFATFWYLIPVALTMVQNEFPWFKGEVGETIVNLDARLFLDKTRYHLIKNATLPSNDGTA